MLQKCRDVWVDNVKVVACALVALGHFFQSMVQAGVLPETGLYLWFDQTIYYFHVPLFFICSGYLYQKYGCVNSVRSWWKNVRKKALGLGVPYFTFSIATWLLKSVFSDSVNSQAMGLFDTLFLYPTSQFWYLYCLFFVFLITPTFPSRKAAGIGLLCAAALNAAFFAGWNPDIRAVSTVMANEIWFVLGMCLSMNNFTLHMKKTPALVAGTGLLALFTAASVWVCLTGFSFFGISTVMGLMACAGVILIMAAYFSDHGQNKLFGFLAKYTLPIYVMHTIFAAGMRSALLKLGIGSALVHTVLGIGISFAGPIIAAVIMQKSKWLEFFLYPGKFIKIK